VAIPPDQFARIADRVDLQLLAARHVIIVGVGTVGSQVARELANSGVGRLRLMDGDTLERHNLPRHALTAQYLGMNKAEAMAVSLDQNVPTLSVDALARYVDSSLDDTALDHLLAPADLIVACTDNREAQRRLGRRALALDIPAVFPALYRNGGGETFVQLRPGAACFFCWDGFRPADEALRGVTALNLEGLSVIQLAAELSLGVLDPASDFARTIAGTAADPRPRQLVVQRPFAAPNIATVPRRPGCPSCAVGPATPVPPGPSRSASVSSPPETSETVMGAATSPASEVPSEWPDSVVQAGAVLAALSGLALVIWMFTDFGGFFGAVLWVTPIILLGIAAVAVGAGFLEDVASGFGFLVGSFLCLIVLWIVYSFAVTIWTSSIEHCPGVVTHLPKGSELCAADSRGSHWGPPLFHFGE